MTTDHADTEQAADTAGSDSKRLVMLSYPPEIPPPEGNDLLVLVDYEDGDDPVTWYGEYKDGKWFGVALDDEGMQELFGKVIGWAFFPKLHAA